jgi:hypothetical protein
MSRHRNALGITLLLAVALAASAQTGAKGTPAAANPNASAPSVPAKGPRKATTLQGEILDMSCYVARGFHGQVHQDCALRCIQSGVCMGIMGPDSMLYMLTLDHGRAMAPSTFTTPDPFGLCKQWAGQTVEVVGLAYDRAGMRIIEVSRAKLIAAPAPTASK